MTNDYGVEIMAQPMYATIPLEDFEALKKESSKTQILRDRVAMLESENNTLKEINANLQAEIMEMWTKCNGKM